MGARGPVPKRTEARLGHVTKAEKGSRTKIAASGAVPVPETPAHLHEIAAQWFDSLKESAQSRYYEPSDWAAALLTAEAMTKMLNAKKFSSMAFSAVWSSMTDLLTTEGARRRARIEVEREQVEEETPPGVADIDAYREKAQ